MKHYCTLLIISLRYVKKCNQPIQKYKSRHIILSNTKRIDITTKTSKQQQSLSLEIIVIIWQELCH